MQTESQVLLLATPKLPAHMQLQLQHLDRLVAIKLKDRITPQVNFFLK